MAEHESMKHEKTKELKKESHHREKAEPFYDQLKATDEGVADIIGGASVNRHARMLANTGSDAQRANLVIHLQQTYGNRYVQRLLNSKAVQAKLTVSQPDDTYEKEADRVADIVTQKISAYEIQRQAPEEEEEEEIETKPASSLQAPEEEEIQIKASEIQYQEVPEEEELPIQPQAAESGHPVVSGEVETRINSARGSGQPLADTIREPMERAMGSDFSDVRVHTNSEANELNQQLSARAFTTGKDVFFGKGEYSPGSSSGRKLIAHELAHVVQQTGRRKPQRQAHKKKMVNAKSITFGSGVRRQSLWGSKKRVQLPNLFASRALQDRVQVGVYGNAPDIQCYKTKMGNVNFESKGWGPAMAGGLVTTVTPNDITIGSQNYEPQITVEAAGPAASVANYKVGFLQTVYAGERNFYYQSTGKAPVKEYVSTKLNTLPVRDANPAGGAPWYNDQDGNDCHQFANAAKSTEAVKMYDAPQDGGPLRRKDGGVNQYLVKTDGKDIFRSWVAVQNVNTKVIALMNWVDWEVDWSTDVQNNPGAPAVNVTGGGKIVGSGEGPGAGKMPRYMGAIANNSVILPRPVTNW